METKITIKKSEFKKLFDAACDTWKPKLKAKLQDFIFDDSITFDDVFFNQMRKACTDDQTKIFNKIFAKYLKAELDIFKITKYENVCKALKRPVLTEKDFSFLPENQRLKSLNHHRIKNLEDFYNQGWIPDWKNHSEYKYHPYFEYLTSGGFRFCISFDLCYGSGGGVGFYKTKEISDFIGKNYIEFYKNI